MAQPFHPPDTYKDSATRHPSHIHSSIPKIETAQMSITDEWVDNMWSIHIVEYYSVIKRNGMSMDELQKCTKKLDTKSHILCDPIYMIAYRTEKFIRKVD